MERKPCVYWKNDGIYTCLRINFPVPGTKCSRYHSGGYCRGEPACYHGGEGAVPNTENVPPTLPIQ